MTVAHLGHREYDTPVNGYSCLSFVMLICLPLSNFITGTSEIDLSSPLNYGTPSSSRAGGTPGRVGYP